MLEDLAGVHRRILHAQAKAHRLGTGPDLARGLEVQAVVFHVHLQVQPGPSARLGEHAIIGHLHVLAGRLDVNAGRSLARARGRDDDLERTLGHGQRGDGRAIASVAIDAVGEGVKVRRIDQPGEVRVVDEQIAAHGGDSGQFELVGQVIEILDIERRIAAAAHVEIAGDAPARIDQPLLGQGAGAVAKARAQAGEQSAGRQELDVGRHVRERGRRPVAVDRPAAGQIVNRDAHARLAEIASAGHQRLDAPAQPGRPLFVAGPGRRPRACVAVRGGLVLAAGVRRGVAPVPVTDHQGEQQCHDYGSDGPYHLVTFLSCAVSSALA